MKATPGTLRAAINQFQADRVEPCWQAQGGAFRSRYPEFAVFAEKLKREHLRIMPNGQIVFEPAFVLSLLRKIEKLDGSVKELKEQIGDLMAQLPEEGERSG